MRLWSLHPKYLDQKGLVALWREGLLAQAVLAGKTRGYTSHPQLARFAEASAPRSQIAAYLRAVHVEATCRGYDFDLKKIGRSHVIESLVVSTGQLDYEWTHLINKLRVRAPAWLADLGKVKRPEPHPLFQITDGGIAEWEVGARGRGHR